MNSKSSRESNFVTTAGNHGALHSPTNGKAIYHLLLSLIYYILFFRHKRCLLPSSWLRFSLPLLQWPAHTAFAQLTAATFLPSRYTARVYAGRRPFSDWFLRHRLLYLLLCELVETLIYCSGRLEFALVSVTWIMWHSLLLPNLASFMFKT